MRKYNNISEAFSMILLTPNAYIVSKIPTTFPFQQQRHDDVDDKRKNCTNQTWHELIIISKSIHVEWIQTTKIFHSIARLKKKEYIIIYYIVLGSTIARITAKVDHKKSNRAQKTNGKWWKLLIETKRKLEEEDEGKTTTATTIYSLENLIDPFPFKKKSKES